MLLNNLLQSTETSYLCISNNECLNSSYKSDGNIWNKVQANNVFKLCETCICYIETILHFPFLTTQMNGFVHQRYINTRSPYDHIVMVLNQAPRSWK